MKLRVKQTCDVRSSSLGAKGFLYPCDESTDLSIREGTIVEFMSYVSYQTDNDLQAISIRNSEVNGSSSDDRVGVYWVSRKNLERVS